MALIELTCLTHRFPDGTTGVKNVDLCIEEGECVVLTGRNGSGKTVLARHLNGLMRPTTGKVTVAGMDVEEDLLRARRLVGLVFQNTDSQVVGETVSADIAFGLKNLGLKREEIDRRVDRMLVTMDLRHVAAQPCHVLSGGEKQRLAVASVLVMEPRMVIFDEPFSSLDYPGLLQVREQIRRLSANGCAVLVITHDLQAVIHLAARLLIMEEGEIVRDGVPESLVEELEGYGVRRPSIPEGPWT